MMFLLPNLIGFLIFTAGPIFFSLYMSLTDWALTKHNEFSTEPIRFVGMQNYQRLLVGDESVFFWDYLGNTIFLMIGIPISIAGSLALALLINAKATPQAPRIRIRAGVIALVIGAIVTFFAWLATTPGPLPDPASPLLEMSAEVGLTDKSLFEVARLRSISFTLITAVFSLVIALGLIVGSVFFRTVYYLPSLLASVPMFLFWKTLYRPRGGLINAVLDPALDTIQTIITSTPRFLWYALGIALWTAAIIWAFRLMRSGINKLVHKDAGAAAFIGRTALVLTMLITAYGVGAVLVQAPQQSMLRSGFTSLDRSQTQTIADSLAAEFPTADTAELNLIARNTDGSSPDDAARFFATALPDDALPRTRTIARAQAKPLHDGLTSGDGLTSPEWLLSPSWAKTALVVMGIWTAIGGANMLLYLAGLANIPPELYEAADIDGASGWQRFVHVTWPQLAPTTFFIVVMSVIAGVQGGFEQAMVMTEGKADTITLSYYLYNIGFSDRFELGLACAIAWVMFAMIFVLTIFNFRVGNQLTND